MSKIIMNQRTGKEPFPEVQARRVGAGPSAGDPDPHRAGAPSQLRCLFIKDHSALTKHLKLPGILSNRVTGGAAD